MITARFTKEQADSVREMHSAGIFGRGGDLTEAMKTYATENNMWVNTDRFGGEKWVDAYHDALTSVRAAR